MRLSLSPPCASIAVVCCLLGLANPAGAVGFSGQFWDESDTINDLAQALAIIAARAPDATFTATAIDYPNGALDTLDDTAGPDFFLGADGGSLDPVLNTFISDSIWRITGALDLDAGLHDFAVGSDDGFQLSLNGSVVSSFADQRSFEVTSVSIDVPGGPTLFDLVVFEHFGVTGFTFTIDGAVVDTTLQSTAVPLPASLPLFSLTLMGLAYLRRRA